MRGPLALVVLALLLPSSVASAPSASETALACVGPVELIACLEGTVDGTFECAPFDVDHVSCWANATWAYRGFTNLPAVVTGNAQRSGGLNVEWCDIGGLCRGVGLGLLIVGCNYQPGSACGGTFQYSMWLGTPRIPPGMCIDFTFKPWIYVTGDISPPALSRVGSAVLHGDNGPLLRAYAAPEVVDHVCN